jgi:nucleoside-diphosphate-sugar epimerase
VIPRFATACLRGQAPTVFGDGEQTRDFTFVGDAVAANLLAADAKRAPGEVLNVAGGRRVSLNELLGEIRSLTGASAPARYQPARAGDVRDSLADLSRARELLGYEPETDLRSGLRRTIEHLASAEES